MLKSNYWLSCWEHTCDRKTCPGVYITEADKMGCRGERFRIYRASGPGIVRAGDLIGIYYPYGSSWLGCAGSECVRASCPGTLSTTYGFQDIERWYRCYGEVFKIYARGKGIGDAIEEHDHVSLFHLQQQKWLSMTETIATISSCPGSVRPRTIGNYERCWGETFEIWTWW